jgi:hypothetical protein
MEFTKQQAVSLLRNIHAPAAITELADSLIGLSWLKPIHWTAGGPTMCDRIQFIGETETPDRQKATVCIEVTMSPGFILSPALRTFVEKNAEVR